MRENNKAKCTCSMCNKALDVYDKQMNFKYERTVGYGSIFDGDYISIQLCCECADKIITKCNSNTQI